MEKPILDIYNAINELYNRIEEYDNSKIGYKIKYLADYYRINIENKKSVFEVDFPEYNNSYFHLNNHANILKLSNKYNINSYIVRDLTKYYMEFSYLNGYKKKNTNYETLDLTDYKTDDSKKIITKMQ